jgi:uncharacterized protein (TIGR02284 family)
MATLVGIRGDVKTILFELIELDYDAAAAYGAAIARMKDGEAKAALAGFKADHERHVKEVGEQLQLMGGEPPKGPDVRGVLTEGMVVVAGLIGDRAILRAMKANEDDSNKAYERAAARQDMNAELLALMKRSLEDERRHRAWIVERLKERAVAAHP